MMLMGHLRKLLGCKRHVRQACSTVKEAVSSMKLMEDLMRLVR